MRRVYSLYGTSVGKKYTALALDEEMRKRGMNSDFRATGQTGVLISGRGVALDAVIADFISGAAEWISPTNDEDHWDCIEGQGSLFHPGYSGVALGLLHGSQPDAFVLCHDAARTAAATAVLFGVPVITTDVSSPGRVPFRVSSSRSSATSSKALSPRYPWRSTTTWS